MGKTSMSKILIVGAGLSGCVLAERFASIGHEITMIDKRDHVGGNIFDHYVDDILVSKYGAHIFHTSYEDVWKYVTQFAVWEGYEHRVLSRVDGKLVPIPINIDTVNEVMGTDIKNETEMRLWLELQGAGTIENPGNSEESALNRIGSKELYEKMIKYYTYKQWNMFPEKLEASVLDRIPVRLDHNDRYFSDKYEGIPKGGYTKFVTNMIGSHEYSKNIGILLNTDYFEFIGDKNPFKVADFIFFTGKIDSYFQEKFGKLEYRSLRFVHEIHDVESYQPSAVVNYPMMDVDYTRIIEHKKIYGQKSPKTLITKEYSSDVGEPYYPIPNEKNRNLYEKYQKEAEKAKGVCFVGRLANYKYFNMDQAIKNALDIFEEMKGKI